MASCSIYSAHLMLRIRDKETTSSLPNQSTPPDHSHALDKMPIEAIHWSPASKPVPTELLSVPTYTEIRTPVGRI